MNTVSESDLFCSHRPPCPGCPRFNEAGLAPFAQGMLEELARQHAIAAPVAICGARQAFRLRARLAIRGRVGSPKIGLFEAGRHRVVHIPNCVVQHPLINHAANIVRKALAETRVSSYSEAAHQGVARYLQVVVERRSQSAQVVLVANSMNAEELLPCVGLIRERLGEQLQSIWFNSNRTQSNNILGPEFENLHGPQSIIENFGGSDVYFPPGAFGQSNLELAERIIAELRLEVPLGSRVAEFYAGSGAIGLSLLSKLQELRVNEVAPHSLRGLDFGISALDPAAREKVSVIAGTAAQAREAADGVDVVIVDPPRKGLDTELTDFLAEHPPARLLYLSCGLPSLRQDIGLLTSRGRLRLTKLNAFNLFPYTEHVETLARFDRV
jgi:23S rRNA (uracil1939-C5)-methyltransferase